MAEDEYPALLLAVPLTYQVRGDTLHCPVADAVVGSHPTMLIVDTGATVHVLTVEVVDRAELARVPGVSGTDAAGGEVPSWDVEGPPLELGGTSLVVGTVPAIEGPALFSTWGVGGFLSPQCLWPDQVVVVDFAQGALEVYGADTSLVRDTLRTRLPDAIFIEGRLHESGTIGTEIAIPPAENVVAIFDSGAASTEVVMAAVPDGELMRTRSVGGTEMQARAMATSTLVAGQARFWLNALYVVPQMAVPDGSANDELPAATIGMDLLRETMLVISPRKDKVVWWVVPATHSALRNRP